MAEAPLKETEGGLEPAGEGWFVVNARDACWWRDEAFGWGTIFDAGQGPCAILMVGARTDEEEFVCPVSEVARRHGAGVPEETTEPRVADAPYPRSERARLDFQGLPWQNAS